jgi:RNA-directed DNA polymerase
LHSFTSCRFVSAHPNVGALDAVDQLTVTLQLGRSHVVGEADMQGFVDHIQPDGLIRRVQERREDGALLRLIRKGLRAGVRETDGPVIQPGTGTPPGGVLSPLWAQV